MGDTTPAPGQGDAKPVRGSALSPQDKYLLDQWGRQLREAFGDTAYLVGSAGYGGERHPRDVDGNECDQCSTAMEALG